MKKIFYPILILHILLFASSCANQDNDEEITQLQLQVAELENQKLQNEIKSLKDESNNEAKDKEQQEREEQEARDKEQQEREEQDARDKEQQEREEQEARDKELDQEPSTGDPRKDEINMFKRIVNENTSPACNIYGIAPCPKWPGFVKTKPDKNKLPIYKETSCKGEFNNSEYLLNTQNKEYIDCLINASKSNAEPYVIQGSKMDPGVKEAVIEAQKYGAEILGNWGPILNVFVRYGEPDLEYVATQECLYREKYGAQDFNSCYEYQYWYYRTFDDCCGAMHGTPVALAPVRFQSMTYNGPDKQFEGGNIHKTTLHEYFHVWQSAYKVHPHETRCSDEENKLCELGNGPLWLEEGSAEYFAVYFAEKKAWANLKSALTGSLTRAQYIYDKWGFTLEDSHQRDDKDKLDQHECNCGGAIMYDMGIWGVVWLINKSGSKEGFLTEFYPNVAYIGYEQAFINAFGLSLDDFYVEFSKWFDETTKTEKLKIIDTISKY